MLKNFYAETLVDKAFLIGLADNPPKNIPVQLNPNLYRQYATELKTALNTLSMQELVDSKIFATRAGMEIAEGEMLAFQIGANREVLMPVLDSLMNRLTQKKN